MYGHIILICVGISIFSKYFELFFYDLFAKMTVLLLKIYNKYNIYVLYIYQ